MNYDQPDLTNWNDAVNNKPVLTLESSSAPQTPEKDKPAAKERKLKPIKAKGKKVPNDASCWNRRKDCGFPDGPDDEFSS